MQQGKNPRPVIPLNSDISKVPPQNVETEETVLGALIMDSTALVEILPVLKVEVFYKESNQIICEAILLLVERDVPVDIMTITDQLQKMGSLDLVGGSYQIATLSNRVSTTSNTPFHYRIILERYFRRKMILICQETITKAYDDTFDVFETYDQHYAEMDEIEVHIAQGSFISSKQVYADLIEQISQEKKRMNFFPIEDPGIDKILMISPSNLVNISGKSGAGKTSFVAYLARMVLRNYKDASILWYTMEDPASKIICNFISPDIKLTHGQINEKNYKLTMREKELIARASKDFGLYDIEFVDKPSYMTHIKTHFQRFCSKRPNKFNILIVDNIMLLRDNQQYRFKSRNTDTDDHIAGMLQNTFTSTKNQYMVNIWYLHHLTKEQLSKTNFVEGYRPREDNIKGSTRLRDIATQGILINRPAEFPDITKFYKGGKYEGPISRLLVGEVFKNRDGNTGFFRYFTNLDYKIFYPF